jgi:glycosyltransferase involved in cell wall biosynthesis
MREGVTVLIPFYNPGMFLKDAVESVFRQTYDQWKLILINDASTDQSIDGVEKYLEDCRVKVIHNFENIGQSKSLNKGLKLVDTDFLMLLNSDDWLVDNALEVFMHEVMSVPDEIALMLCNVNIVYWDDDKGIQKHSEICRKPEWGYSYQEPHEILLANLFPWQKFYRTSAIKHLGGWPTDDPCEGRYTEDLAMFLRLIEQYRFQWIDQVLYNYRLHRSSLMNDREIVADMVEWLIRNALIRWGDKYTPVFKTTSDGWKLLDKLEPK